MPRNRCQYNMKLQVYNMLDDCAGCIKRKCGTATMQVKQFTSTVIKVQGGMKHRNANPAMCRPSLSTDCTRSLAKGFRFCGKFSLRKRW